MILKIKSIKIEYIKKYSKMSCGVGKLPRFIPNHKHSFLTTSELRSRFIDYFLKHDHKYIKPCSLNSKSTGSYFVNSGVTQFKEHILGQKNIFTDVSKAVNSQRCVRLGGKKCDLNDIGYDSTHLSYFEMLGNWSFGSYDKREACKLMWKFLTEELELPQSHLYVTYFGGSGKLGIPADDETRDIWFSIGVKDSKVLQFGEEHNFWEMGQRSENTLCGPSTEIHWDYLATMTDSNDPRCARCFVNSTSPEVAELWNCVFMEYKWIDGGKTLSKLPALIIDTGMGLERLASINQGVCSVFDTDGFKEIMSHLSVLSKSPTYQGTFPMATDHPVSQRLKSASEHSKDMDSSLRRDVAYRIIADHLRTICLSVNDGIRPGRQFVELKVRQLLHRAIRQSNYGLGMTGGLSPLVDTVCESLTEWYDIDSTVRTKLKNIIDQEESTFFPKLHLHETAFNNFLLQRDSKNMELCEDEILSLSNGKFGERLSIDMIRAMCRDVNLNIRDDFEDKDNQDPVDQSCTDDCVSFPGSNLLFSCNIPVTDDRPTYDYRFNEDFRLYEVSDLETSITSLLLISPLEDEHIVNDISPEKQVSQFGLLTERTNMFPTKGGQECDKGVLLSGADRTVIATVDRVAELDSGHIIHWCTFIGGGCLLRVSDKVVLHVDSEHRTGVTLHHSGHHILFAALNKLLGRVNQSSSSVKHDGARMRFSVDIQHGIDNVLNNEQFAEKVENLCSEIIGNQIPILMKDSVKFDQISQDNTVRYLKSEGLRDDVRLVTIGDTSEVCCGTHARNSGHIQDIVITAIKRSNQAISEITFVVGKYAVDIRRQDKEIKDVCTELNGKSSDQWDQIDNVIQSLKCAISQREMSKGTRDIVIQTINTAEKRLIEAPSVADILQQKFSSHESSPKDVCTVHIKTISIKKAVTKLLELNVKSPVIMYDSTKVLIYFPKANIYSEVCEFVDNYGQKHGRVMSDFVVELPKVRKLDSDILSKFISITVPDTFQKCSLFVDDLKKLVKDL